MRWFRVQAKPEFVYQNCVKLIGHGGAHTPTCALKSLFIQNTSSITKSSPYFCNYMLWSQKLKVCSKLSELIFFPHKCLLHDVILTEGINKSTSRKYFLREKFIWTLWEISACRKCKHYSQGFICFTFVLWRVTGYLPLFK